MPKFSVSYETSIKPTDAPDGAKVTQLSALPATVKGEHTFGIKWLKVKANSWCGGGNGVIIEIPDDDICLSADSVDTLIEALTEARGKETVKPKVADKSVLPLSVTFGKYKDIDLTVEVSALEDKAAYVQVHDSARVISEWMSPAATKELYLALKEIVGD